MQPFDQPFIGHDSAFHYLRVEALKYNIEQGTLCSGIDYLYLGGAGYAASAYPDVFLYIPALLRIMGVGIGMSMTIFLTLCNVLSYIFMFLCVKKISTSSVGASIAACFYVLSSYRLDNIFTRFALGEVQAYVFWPLILLGLYDFIFGDFRKPYILGIGFIGMILSHTISTAIALGICVLISLVFLHRLWKKPRKFLTLLLTVSLVLGITAFYWIPLLELLSSCDMSVNYSAYHVEQSIVKFLDVFKDASITGIGIPIFLLCLPRLLLMRRSPIRKAIATDNNSDKRPNALVFADAAMCFGILLALLPSDLAPWMLLTHVLDFMQFPWRFYAIASTLIAVGGAIYITYLIQYTNAKKVGMVVLAGVTILCASVHFSIINPIHAEVYPDDYYSQTDATFSVGMGEWMPHAAQGSGVDTVREFRDTVAFDDGTRIACMRENGTLTFTIQDLYSPSYVTLPYVWYPGYHASDETGQALQTSMSDHGLVEVNTRNIHGQVTVTYRPTGLRVVSYCISAATFLLSLILYIIIFHAEKLRHFKSARLLQTHKRHQ